MTTQKHNLLQKFTQIVTDLKNTNCDITQKTQMVKDLKTQIVTKHKNSNCDKTQKHKLWQNSKSQIVTKLEKLNCDQNSKIVTKNKTWQNFLNFFLQI